MNTSRTFRKYKQNLRVVNYDGADYVMSYTTRVAKIDYGTSELIQLGYWSMTTQKHINYAAQQLGLSLIKPFK
jgi:hypothetical protein